MNTQFMLTAAKIDLLQDRLFNTISEDKQLLIVNEIDILTQDLSLILELIKADISILKRDLNLNQTT